MEKPLYYEGEVLLGKLHGKGKITSPDGLSLEGIFKDGFPEGEATDTLPNGNKYLIEVANQKLIRKELISPENSKRVKPRHPGQSPLDSNNQPLPYPPAKTSLFPGLFFMD